MARVFRLLLACIVMFAVPIQGFASTTMLLCGVGAGHHASLPDVANSAPSPALGEHDHAKHGHGTHGTAPEVKAGDNVGQIEVKTSTSDVSHKCGACASCCHLVAISQPASKVLAVPLSQSALAEPPARVASLPTLVPDKPPRA